MGDDGFCEMEVNLWTEDQETNNANDREVEVDSESAVTEKSKRSSSVGKKKPSKTGKIKEPRKPRRIEKDRSQAKRVCCTVESCMYTTPYPKDLSRHMRKHTGEKPFTCDVCSKSFSRYDKLVGHKRAHESVKPNKCNLCDYAALDACSLRKHLRVHSDERPYKCQLCPYRSRDSSQLIVHLRHHTGDSPYVCNYQSCQSAFKTPSDLQRHSRHHTGEKPYSCSICEYKAAVKCNLNAHMKKYHNVQGNFPGTVNVPAFNYLGSNFEASELNPPNLSSESLMSDSATISSEKVGHLNKSLETVDYQFACKLCNYKGETIKHFQSHMRRKHKAKQNQSLAQDTLPPKKRNLNNFSKLFSCSTCAATFVRDDSLRCHMRQHAALGPPPMPVIHPTQVPIESQQIETTSTPPYDLSDIQVSPYLTEAGDYLPELQVDEMFAQGQSVSLTLTRPQVITYADRRCV